MSAPSDRTLRDRDPDAQLAVFAIQVANRRMARRYPFHAHLLARWHLIPTRDVATLAVGAHSDGLRLLVNPAFVLAITDEQLCGALHHGLNHVLFGHLSADPSRYPDQAARTIAEEVTVNEWIRDVLPGAPILLADFPQLPPNEDTDTRYRRLVGTVSEPVANFDDHGAWGVVPGAEQLGHLAAREVIRSAAQEAGPGAWAALPSPIRAAITRAYGSDPSGRLVDLLHSDKRSVDWRGALRRVVAATLEPAPRFGRPPRRFPHLVGVVPARVHAVGRRRLLAVVDTSASIDANTLADMAAELDALGRWADITVVECDAAIQAVYSYADGLRRVFTGGGGTDLRPPFEPQFLRTHRPDAIVYFTDGCGPAPARPPRVPVFWCLTAGGRAPAPWGRRLEM